MPELNGLTDLAALQKVMAHYFSTSDALAARDYILKWTDGNCEFSVRQPKRFNLFDGAQARLHGTRIELLKWNADSECQTAVWRSSEHRVIFHLPLRGEFCAVQEGRHVQVRPGQLLLIGTEGKIIRHWRGGSELLKIMVDRSALKRALAVDFALDTERRLEFDRLSVVDLSKVDTLSRYLMTLISDLASQAPAFADPFVASQAEKTLLMLLLKCTPHSYSNALDGPPSSIASSQVRRAEQYMRLHIGEAITMKTLARASATSVRTLYYGFKRYRNTTPMRHLKHLRLTRARNQLFEGLGEVRISDVAARVGYSRLSQFSRDYKSYFGESPVATSRRQTAQRKSDESPCDGTRARPR